MLPRALAAQLLAVLVLLAAPALAQRPLPLPPPWPETVPPPPGAAQSRPPAQQGLPAPPPMPPPPPPRREAEPAVPVRPADAPLGPSSRQPLPRFVSLGSSRINLRSGPGTQHPIEWTYQRSGWPVEVVREFGVWRRVRDHDGTEGWVQQTLLSPRRTLLVRGDTRPLRRRADDAAPVVARLSPGVVGRIRRCEAGAAWCEVEVRGHRGWLRRSDFWGTYAGEAVR